jgi:hypothetical protein
MSGMPTRMTVTPRLIDLALGRFARAAGGAVSHCQRDAMARMPTGLSWIWCSAHRLDWLVASAAILPMALVYLLHYLCAPAGYSATGFLQYDQASYMANARAVFAHGPSLTYGVPFSPFDATPRIYFQPIAVLLGAVWAVTGWAPGTIYVGLGVIAGIAMFRVALALAVCFDGRPRDAAGWLARAALLWGGGISVLLGVPLYWLGAKLGANAWQAATALDFGDGYWFLDLGRNVYYAIEAANHVLFLGCIVLLLRRHYRAAFAVMAVLAANHPITGVELICVVGAFALCEQVLHQPEAPPRWFFWATVALLVAHLGYWLIALRILSPEHRVIEQQWTDPGLRQAFVLPMRAIVVDYGPVMMLAVLRLLRQPAWPAALRQQPVRLGLVWFIVAFALANHEVFMPARQPLHFTRGYVWTPLALIALPLVADGFRWAVGLRGRVLARLRGGRMANLRAGAISVAAAGLMLAVMVLDNATWFARHYRDLAEHTETNALLLRDDQRAVLERLAAPDMAGRLVLSADPLLGYLATVYPGLRAWRSHAFNTPWADLRQAELDRFFADAEEVPEWRHRSLVVVLDDADDRVAGTRLGPAGFLAVATYGHYTILVRQAS